MEAHSVNLELKYQNKTLKDGQHGQFLKAKSNKAQVKHDIDVIETINIELEHKVAKLLKENETLKRHYKELSDSIKTTRAKTIEHTTSLIAKNIEFKAPTIVQLILFIVDSGCTKHMTGNLKMLCNFVKKYLGTVQFGNDQFAPILGYEDLVHGNIRSIGDLQGNDLLIGNRGSDLYTISLQEMTSSTLICLMAKASPTQAHTSTKNFNLSKKSNTPTNVNAEENNDNQAEDAQFQQDEFINPFYTPDSKSGKYVDKTLLAERNQGGGSLLHNSRWVRQSDHPEKVYRLRKALYGLKQAPRAWYDELSNFLMSKGFTKGTIDPTLFTIRYGEDILLVQIYIDDIIFGSTNPKFSKRFEKIMHSRFEMSLIGEMKFFLGLQIHQSSRGIFINQAKYALEILKKHGMEKCDTVCTPMATKPKLDADLSGKLVDQTDYHSKIGSLMYLTSSRPDTVQAVCYCVRYQARPTEKHLKEVKRIFRYLRGTINMGLWYPKDSGFELTAFLDADHAGCIDTRKSTSGGIQFLGDKLISWCQEEGVHCYVSSRGLSTWRLSAWCCFMIMWMRERPS
ncbi:retrovirus-related pol polyprotein from transposon TNT 1-94 [Tanacetum coccineum]